ncbi:hypothetical protein B296_00016741 [Ensete ventricosum]|uniref:Uncharacterized protein n=1 Tax=Ensete ventricosum TaxID=4639 RepID=A0A427AB98_ENSVE|nr:hypothetical protein B296_00016741 [Ensete ventricosum]
MRDDTGERVQRPIGYPERVANVSVADQGWGAVGPEIVRDTGDRWPAPPPGLRLGRESVAEASRVAREASDLAAGSALCSWLFGYLAVRSGGEVVDPSESMEPPVAAFG